MARFLMIAVLAAMGFGQEIPRLTALQWQVEAQERERARSRAIDDQIQHSNQNVSPRGAVLTAVAVLLTVAQTHDTTAPTLTALGLSPSTVDTSAGPVDVTITWTATDSLSGVATLTSPSPATPTAWRTDRRIHPAR